MKASVRMATWTVRAMVASDGVARRQGTTLSVPVKPDLDPDGGVVVQLFYQRRTRWATRTPGGGWSAANRRLKDGLRAARSS